MTIILAIFTDGTPRIQLESSNLFMKLRTSLAVMLWPTCCTSPVTSFCLSPASNCFQLSASDPFENVKRRFLLDLNFDRRQSSWTAELNFAFSIVNWMSYWGCLYRFNTLILMRLLLSFVNSCGEGLLSSNQLLSQILIKLPSGLINYICGGIEGTATEETRQTSNEVIMVYSLCCTAD